MASVFIKLLNLSISAGMLIILVLAFRLILMRMSRRAACMLWIVVGLRLVIPFSFESSLSIMPSGDFVVLEPSTENNKAETLLSEVKSIDEINRETYFEKLEPVGEDYISSIDNNGDIDYYLDPVPSGSFPKVTEKYISPVEDNSEIDYYVHTNPSVTAKDNISANKDAVIIKGNGNDETLYALPTQIPENSVTDTVNVQTNFLDSLPGRLGFQARHFWDILAYVWLVGFVFIAGYAVIGYIQMKRMTAEAILYREAGRDNIYICDRIDTAFIFGIIKPKIYLPSNLTGKQLENVIAHENVHLLRRDYLRKLIGFLLLMVYWFNPLTWIAYAYFCKDIEFACDEQVISTMTPSEIKEYSSTLLFCSTNMHFMYGCPLAFGEVAVKDRVKAALHYKKPLFWLIILVFIILVGFAIFFFIKPSSIDNTDDIINHNGGTEHRDYLVGEIVDVPVDGYDIAETFETGDAVYYRLKNGKYKWKDYIYDYRLEIDDPQNGGKFIYLSNLSEISYEYVMQDIVLNSVQYHFPPDVAIFIDLIVDGKSVLVKTKADPSDGSKEYDSDGIGVADHDAPISLSNNSVESILNGISQKYKYSLINDFEFTYVLPDGTELKNDFGYNSGMNFIDYVKTWPKVSTAIKDRTQQYFLTVDKKSKNGYLIISTGEGYLSENKIGYRMCIKDDYVHLFSYDETGEEYLGSAKFKNNFAPNMYSVRRMLFTKDMYDVYVTSCLYEEEINEPGIYPVNKGFLIDLDGDGKKEKVFIASCGWINYPEEDNLEGWVTLSNHSGSYRDYESYYGINGGVLVYINGKLMNDPLNVYGSEWSSPAFAFALTDVDVSDGRYEILVQDDLGDIFYIYNEENADESRVPGNPSGFSTRIPGSWLVRRIYDNGPNQMPQAEFSGIFNGDGTFTGPGDVSLYRYNFRLSSDNITWSMDKDGNIERVSGVFDVSEPVLYNEETIGQIQNDAAREYWKTVIKEHPEEVYLKLELILKVLIPYDHLNPDSDESKLEMEPGYVYVDQTDGVSWIHLVSPYTGVSGWIDLDNIENYVKDYPETGLAEAGDYEKMDIMFSNINHAG